MRRNGAGHDVGSGYATGVMAGSATSTGNHRWHVMAATRFVRHAAEEMLVPKETRILHTTHDDFLT